MIRFALKYGKPTALGLFVSLAALHSIILGIILIVAPTWLLSLFGWSIDCHRFFLQQAGVFHILLGTFYGIEYFIYHHIRMLLMAKISAVIFLTVQGAWTMAEPGIFLSNIVDGSIAVIAAFLWLREAQSLRRGDRRG